MVAVREFHPPVSTKAAKNQPMPPIPIYIAGQRPRKHAAHTALVPVMIWARATARHLNAIKAAQLRRPGTAPRAGKNAKLIKKPLPLQLMIVQKPNVVLPAEKLKSGMENPSRGVAFI